MRSIKTAIIVKAAYTTLGLLPDKDLFDHKPRKNSHPSRQPLKLGWVLNTQQLIQDADIAEINLWGF
ncbi:hypothetical protein ES703_25079 [subsurface metagenome]